MIFETLDTFNAIFVAAKNKNKHYALNSTSAGVFGELAENIISKGGIIFGASFDPDFKVYHRCVTNKKDVDALRKSKYVKSDLRNSFSETKRYLANNKYVLFSGTPCQIAALKHFLGKEYKRLLVVDTVCHGTCLPWVWEAYLNGLKKKYNGEIESVEFRKKDGIAANLHGHNLYVKIGKEELCSRDAYLEGFLSGLYLLPSCYCCQYKNFDSGSDIKLGDFWGIETAYPEFCDIKNNRPVSDGISEVILLTEKGRMAFDEIKHHFWWFVVRKRNFKAYLNFGNYNNLTKSTPKHKNSDRFIKDFSGCKYINAEQIYRYLGIKKAVVSTEPHYDFGAIGSLGLSRIFAEESHFSLAWHFSGSNIMSMTSFPVPRTFSMNGALRNPYLIQIFEDDWDKNLLNDFDFYANNVAFLILDLLDERFLPYKASCEGKTTFITGTRLLNLTEMQYVPADSDSLHAWKKHCLGLIMRLKERFSMQSIFVCESYLAKKYWVNDNTKTFPNVRQIEIVNNELKMKYQFMKEHMHGANFIRFDYGDVYAGVEHNMANPAIHECGMYRFYARLIKYILEKQQTRSSLCSVNKPLFNRILYEKADIQNIYDLI